MNSDRLSAASAAIFSLLVLYLAFFFRLGALPFVGADEPRYARIGEEMAQGADWVTPTLRGRPWLEKPPLLYWLDAASFLVLGSSEGAARLPIAVLGALTAVLIAWLGYRIADTRTGLFSGLILATSPLFVGLARSATTDIPLTAGLTAALVFAHRALTDRRLAWPILSGISLAAAALAKGPVAPVLFAGIVVLFALLRRRRSWSGPQIVVALVSFGTAAVPWYWLIWQRQGYDFVLTFWLNHHIARFISDLHHHSRPVWYYLPILAAGFFPWILFAVPSGRRKVEAGERQDPDRLFLWLWVGVPLLFFSLSSSKLAAYILPIFPPLAVLAARQWDRFVGVDLTTYRGIKTRLRWMYGIGWTLAAALPIAAHHFYGSAALGFLLAAPLAGGLALPALRPGIQPATTFLTITATMTLFIATAYGLAAPTIGKFHSAKDVSLEADLRISQDHPLVFYRYFHHSARYYTGYRTTAESLHSLESLTAYFRGHPQSDYIVLTARDGWLDLSTYFHSELLRREGNLFLTRVDPRTTEPKTASADLGEARLEGVSSRPRHCPRLGVSDNMHVLPWACDCTTRSRGASNPSRRSSRVWSACTAAAPRSTTTPTSAT